VGVLTIAIAAALLGYFAAALLFKSWLRSRIRRRRAAS
jgi:hypothetical protein